MKKQHWTQTPEGRIRSKALLDRGKAAVAARRKFGEKLNNGSLRHARKEDPTEEQFIYALGRTQGWLEAYAAGTGRSVRSLAEQVGSALLHDSSRTPRGHSQSMRDL